MGGGILQLLAKGKMDVYLTGNPEFSFFKAVYRRHTNFSIESIKQQFTNTGIHGENMKCKLSRSGDLIGPVTLEVILERGDAENIDPNGTYLNWVNNTGHAFIKECELKIGNHFIDRHTSQWMDIYNELYDKDEQEWIGLNKHPGKYGYLKSGNKNIESQKLKLYIPLHFWFCDNPGLYLPIIAITEHDVEINLVTRPTDYLFNVDGELSFTGTRPEVDMWCDYIFLDEDEKMKFINTKKAYLIQQTQIYEKNTENINHIKLYHPVKQIIWVTQDITVMSENGNGSTNIDPIINVSGSDQTQGNDYFNYQCGSSKNREDVYSIPSYESFRTAKLRLNGVDRFYERDASYFRLVQPIYGNVKVPGKHIYMYNFSINVDEYQPSGTCNLSRIDDIELLFTSDYEFINEKLYVYAINYNVLIISSGMAGLVYK